MFTGIISFQLTVTRVSSGHQLVTVMVNKPTSLRVKSGDSIALNGICTTVVRAKKNEMVFEFMPETRARTTVKLWKRGTILNAEQSLLPVTPLNGHLLMGHIDDVGTIRNIEKQGASRVMRIDVPKKYSALIASKGCVAVDGVSLTVIDKYSGSFTVGLIPYTLQHTTLGAVAVGEKVNIEFDLLAKYLKEIVSKRFLSSRT